MRMKKCLKCGKYTLKEFCPICNEKTVNPEPPKYSPSDKYGEFRRKLIQEKKDLESLA